MSQPDRHSEHKNESRVRIEGISAVTLITRDMARSLQFYKLLGFTVRYGGEESSFASLHAGSGYLNLTLRTDKTEPSWWGRVIFYVADMDAFYEHAVAAGLTPEMAPRDAEWGERYFQPRRS